ncbi:MAG: ABC transporter permease, partial [Acidobacteriota bacterium]
MNFREIFRFEFMYQAHRVLTWLYFAVLVAVAYLLIRGNSSDGARDDGVLVNSPYVIALATAISSLLWVLMAPAVAGSAAARDVQTRMHPLIYTTPVSKAGYLGGRVLAALVLDALILLAVQAGILLALLVSGIDPGILGPFRPAANLSAYVMIALPTAFAVTAFQFSFALLNRRAVASYLGSLLIFVTMIVAGAVTNVLHMPTLGRLLDPIGFVSVVEFSRAWTPLEKNTLHIGLQGSMLARSILWAGIGLVALLFTYRRFHFGESETEARSRGARRTAAMQDTQNQGPVSTTLARSATASTPQVQRMFGFGTHVRQTLAIAWTSFA